MTEPSRRPFELHLDSADLDELSSILPQPAVYGVTTNPTLMRRVGLRNDQLPAFVEQLAAWGIMAVHIQVQSADVGGMLRDARAAREIGPPGLVVPKVPITRAGLAAGAALAAEGVPVTFTAVYAPDQVVLGAAAGATYLAPYLGRLADGGMDALAAIGQMQRLLERYVASTRLLVASVRSRADVLALLDLGVGAVTIPVRLAPELLDHAATIDAERDFLADASYLR